jgi:hypothetical protein
MVRWGSIATCLLLTLSACQPAQTGPVPSPSAQPAPISQSGDLLPESSPYNVRQFDPASDYVHEPTGLVFPKQAAGLPRVGVAEFTVARDDVAADYMDSARHVRITAYVFPVWNMADRRITMADVPATCRKAYEDAKSNILAFAVNPRLVEERDLTGPRFGDAVYRRVAIYEADGNDKNDMGPVRTALYYHCGVDKVWIVQYRTSYPQGTDVGTIIDDVMNAVPTNS